MIQAEEFLRDLSKNPELPENIRREAKRLLRHYPDA
ncbi:BPSL0761 family protein [Pseudomonas cavernae]